MVKGGREEGGRGGGGREGGGGTHPMSKHTRRVTAKATTTTTSRVSIPDALPISKTAVSLSSILCMPSVAHGARRMKTKTIQRWTRRWTKGEGWWEGGGGEGKNEGWQGSI